MGTLALKLIHQVIVREKGATILRGEHTRKEETIISR